MARALIKNASNPNPRNLIINGAMDFWQRGTSAAIAAARTYNSVDRFQCGASGGSSGVLITRSTIVPNLQFKYSYQSVENGDQTGNSMLVLQKIEAANIRPYIGRTMTFSFWSRLTTAAVTGSINVYTPASGVEDSWSVDPLADTPQFSEVITHTLGVWKRFTYTFTIPTAAVNGMFIMVVIGSYSGQPTWNHTGWMLTEGPGAPENFYRAGDDIQEEFAMCQRYYEKSYLFGTAPGTADANGLAHLRAVLTTQAALDVMFKTSKRVSPTMTFASRNGTSGTLTNDSNTSDSAVTITTPQTASTEDRIGVMTVAGATVGTFYRVHWTASAEL